MQNRHVSNKYAQNCAAVKFAIGRGKDIWPPGHLPPLRPKVTPDSWIAASQCER